MVQFSSKAGSAYQPPAPPVCPKCGSHRTEIIGKSDDPTKRTVRCNVCGAISTVAVNEAATYIPEGITSATSAA
jgi:uncharacterized Zn finger protein